MPVSPKRHRKNDILVNHGIIRSIFLKLRDSQRDSNDDVLALQAVKISKKLYGNDTISSLEMEKGFTKLVSGSAVSEVSNDVADAH